MAFVSAVMMLAASPQNFLGLASTQDSFSPTIDVLTVYGRHIRSELKQSLTQVPRLKLTAPVHQGAVAALRRQFARERRCQS
jgi:hypothetical protein